MRIRHQLVVGWAVVAVGVACQAPPATPTVGPTTSPTSAPVTPPASPAAVSTAPSPAVSPSPAATLQATPVAVGASRAEVLASANAAFAGGNLQSAGELYQRVLNTAPGPSETAALSAAEEGLAGFRIVVVDASKGDDAAGRRQIQEMQSRAPSAAFTRLAAQFWDQYGMTADAQAACAQVAPQATQAAAELQVLQGAGVPVQPSALCSVPR